MIGPLFYLSIGSIVFRFAIDHNDAKRLINRATHENMKILWSNKSIIIFVCNILSCFYHLEIKNMHIFVTACLYMNLFRISIYLKPLHKMPSNIFLNKYWFSLHPFTYLMTLCSASYNCIVLDFLERTRQEILP